MIGGSELQILYQKMDSINEEINYLKECKENASDTDYWNSAYIYMDDIDALEKDLLEVSLEIANHVY